MSLDITLLRLMKHRKQFDKLYAGLPTSGLEDTTTQLLADFKSYFREFEDVTTIDMQQFMLWFTTFKHNNYSDERTQMFAAITARLVEDISPEIEDGLMGRLIAAEKAFQYIDTVTKWNDGEDFDLLTRMQEITEDFESNVERKVKTPFVEDSIEDMLNEDDNDVGLHWRLDCLNTSMRPVRGGDFIVIAGRPDKGKTTFLTSELSFMAPQIAKMYGEDRPILWFNNEGPGKRIKMRYYQSLLGVTNLEMIEKLKAGTLRDELWAAAGGNPDRLLRILDVHDFWSHEIEAVLRHHPPGLIVGDMIDNIKFSGVANNGGQRTDQLLEAMYQWGRNLAVKWDCPVFATSQISADGDGLPYPTLPMLKDSKTGKQGAADAIITLGALNDPAMDGFRYIGMTKNKLHRAGGKKDPRTEVIFDMEIARYSNPGA